jgi:hypothetical protein
MLTGPPSLLLSAVRIGCKAYKLYQWPSGRNRPKPCSSASPVATK